MSVISALQSEHVRICNNFIIFYVGREGSMAETIRHTIYIKDSNFFFFVWLCVFVFVSKQSRLQRSS
jgi:hypothetical protein